MHYEGFNALQGCGCYFRKKSVLHIFWTAPKGHPSFAIPLEGLLKHNLFSALSSNYKSNFAPPLSLTARHIYVPILGQNSVVNSRTYYCIIGFLTKCS